MMVPIEDMLPDVLIFAPTAPEPVVLKHLRDCAREFCQRTNAWRDTDSFAVTAPEYEVLAIIQDASLVAIEEARLNGRPLTPITVEDLDRKHPGWGTATEEATARYLTQLQPNTMTVFPRETGELTLRLVLQPSRDAIMVPDWLIEQHGTGIGRGAAGRVLLTPGVEYSNPSLAAPLVSEFSDFLGAKAISVMKGQQRAPKRTKAVWF